MTKTKIAKRAKNSAPRAKKEAATPAVSEVHIAPAFHEASRQEVVPEPKKKSWFFG